MKYVPPKLTKKDNKKGHYILVYYVKNKRYRVSSGHIVNRPDLTPNSYPFEAAKYMWDELSRVIEGYLKQGINPRVDDISVVEGPLVETNDNILNDIQRDIYIPVNLGKLKYGLRRLHLELYFEI